MVEKHGMTTLEGMLLDEHASLTLSELCRTTGLHAEALISMVEEGLVEPQGGAPGEWRFTGECVYRLHVAVRLQRDLQINLAGAALALDLLEELRGLRARVKALESLLESTGADRSGRS